MYDSQLIEYFLTLTAADRRELRKFVRSPFHNQREDVVQLFDYVDANVEKGQLKLKKEVVFAALFPDSAFDAKRLNYAMSFLTKALEAYLTQSEVTRQPEQSAFLLQQALILRGANGLAERAVKQAQSALAASPFAPLSIKACWSKKAACSGCRVTSACVK